LATLKMTFTQIYFDDVLYVVPYCCSWEHVGRHFGNPLDVKGTPQEHFGNLVGTLLKTSKPKKFKNCLEINFGTIHKNKLVLALA
jgi:hypothetical protein